jgi:hypothetical protein
MSGSKTGEAPETVTTGDGAATPRPIDARVVKSLSIQGWWSLAVWLSFGLFLEGLIGFRTPVYLQDEMRRELFRLAHAHGTVFSVVMLVAVAFVERRLAGPPTLALRLLQLGSLIMPLGFLLGGIWHTETDPNIAVFLSPAGALMIIFAVISIALTVRKS